MMSRNGHCIKHVNNVTYLGSYIGSTERDIKIRISQALTALNNVNTIWKSKMLDNLKRNFFRSAIESILIYGSITWTLTLTIVIGKIYREKSGLCIYSHGQICVEHIMERTYDK